MASVGVVPAGLREPSGHAVGVDKLPEEMNDMKIRDDKVCVFFFGLILFLFFDWIYYFPLFIQDA